MRDELLKEENEKFKTGGRFEGVRTGYSSLDERIHGLWNGDLVVLGGRSLTGKTAFALNILRYNALSEGKNCIYFTFSDTASLVAKKLLCQVAGVDMDEIPNEAAKGALDEAAELIASSHIIIDDMYDIPGTKIEKLEEKIRYYDAQDHIDLIVIDYLQMLTTEVPDTYKGQIDLIMQKLKNLSRELCCPIMVISQIEKTSAKHSFKPKLSKLKGPVSIQDEADTVILLHRDDLYDPDSESKGIIDVDIAKDKHGGPNSFRLIFIKPLVKIVDLMDIMD